MFVSIVEISEMEENETTKKKKENTNTKEAAWEEKRRQPAPLPRRPSRDYWRQCWPPKKKRSQLKNEIKIQERQAGDKLHTKNTRTHKIVRPRERPQPPSLLNRLSAPPFLFLIFCDRFTRGFSALISADFNILLRLFFSYFNISPSNNSSQVSRPISLVTAAEITFERSPWIRLAPLTGYGCFWLGFGGSACVLTAKLLLRLQSHTHEGEIRAAWAYPHLSLSLSAIVREIKVWLVHVHLSRGTYQRMSRTKW